METTYPQARAAGAQRWRELAGTAAIGLVGLAAWQVASTLVFVVPEPAATQAALGGILTSDGFWTNVAATAEATTLAFTLAVVVGVLLGTALGLSVYWRRAGARGAGAPRRAESHHLSSNPDRLRPGARLDRRARRVAGSVSHRHHGD